MSGESPTQRQARLRREKREKRILEGGSARLDKITSLSGRSTPLSENVSENKTQNATDRLMDGLAAGEGLVSPPEDGFTSTATHDVPPRRSFERDLSGFDHGAFPTRSFGTSPEPQLGLGGFLNEAAPLDEDPIAKMLQLMGSLADGKGFPPTRGEQQGNPLEPDLPAFPGRSRTSEDGSANHQRSQAVSSAWRILHTLVAAILSCYVLYAYPLAGQREVHTIRFSSLNEKVDFGFFWVFIASELLLQSSRFVLESGQDEVGFLASVAQFLPPQGRSFFLLLAQYGGIWTTTATDAMYIIFIVGLAIWWNGS